MAGVSKGALNRFASMLGKTDDAAKIVATSGDDVHNVIGKGKNLKSFQKLKEELNAQEAIKKELAASKYPKDFQQDEMIPRQPKIEEPDFTMVSDPNQAMTVRPNTLPDVVPTTSSKVIDATGPQVDDVTDTLFNRWKTGGMALAGTAAVGGAYNMMSGDEQPPMMSVQPTNTQITKPETKQTEPDAKLKAAGTKKEIEKVQENKPRQESLPKSVGDQISQKEEELDYLKALKEAQSRQNDLSVMASIIKAGQGFNQAITGVKQDAGDDLEAYAKRLPENVEAQRAMEEKNREINTQRDLDKPNSPIAIQLREKLKKFGINIPEGMSVTQISKATGMSMSILIGHEQNEQARKDAIVARRELAAMTVGQKAESKAEQKDLARDKFAQGLRQELTRGEVGKVYGNYLTAQRSATALSQFADNPNAYTDYGSLMLGLKALQGDQSVVREAEVRMGVNATDLFSKLQNTIQQAASGKTLQPEQRKAMADAARQLANISKEQFHRVASPILNQAKAEGVDESILLGGDFIKKNTTPNAISVVKKGYNPTTDQTQFIYSDGSKEVKDGKL